MGTPIIPSFNQHKMSFLEAKVLIEPFPPQWKYQDTKMTVQKYRPEVYRILPMAMIGPAHGEINKQVCIGKMWFGT
jgi:hypothetical protein